jgi:hypothetical protein
MTLRVGAIFWFISHTMSCQPKGLGLHIYSWTRQPSICRDASLRCCPSNHHAKDHKDQQYKTYSIILPLSLVRRLVGELDHPDPRAKLVEHDPPKGLGEQIRKLVLSVDVARLEIPFLQAASDEVVPHPSRMCLLCSWITWFLARARADLFPTLSSTAPVSLPRRSPSSRTSQSA